MVCRDFILPEPASYVFFYALSNLRKLLYIIHGTVKLFLDLRESRLWIGGRAVGDMGLTNILNDTVQIIMNCVAEKITLPYLSQLQRADIKVVLPRRMAADHFLPGGLQHQIHLGDSHISDPVNENLNIRHQPLEVLVGGNLTQQPVVDFSAAQ